MCSYAILLQFSLYDWVVCPILKGVLFGLVLQNAHFCVCIVLHVVVVAVKVVWRDIQQHGNVSPELVHVVQLETAEFNDVIVIRFSLCYL